MKQFITLGLLGLMALSLMATPLQADFFQCPDGGCDGGDNADIINGSPGADIINGFDGNDIIFGGDGNDPELDGGNQDDVIFGGPGDDILIGDDEDDLLFPGPDSLDVGGQLANGNEGNDMTIVFAGETVDCLVIDDDGGADVVSLIGFGPYTGIVPFGDPELANGWLLIADPIAGGTVAISIQPNNDMGIETINGLLSPNVAVDILPINCIVP